MSKYLETNTGEIITTQSGEPILVSEAVTNNGVQNFDFSIDLLQALLWQYTNADNLQSILNSKQAWYNTNQEEFWSEWIKNVFDLRTANAFGLQVWSILLDQSIYVSRNPTPTNVGVFGFGVYNANFTNGNFGSAYGQTYELPLESARLLLQLRYFQLVSSGTIPEANRMLKYLFENYGLAYLQDNYDMTQSYVFNFTIPADLQILLDNFDILPRPAAVESDYYQSNIATFGFGVYHANFKNGNFGSF